MGARHDFDTVFRDSVGEVVRATWLVVGDEQVARELAQDAFLEALRRWRRIGAYDNPGAWVRRVAINRAVDQRRRRVPRIMAPSPAPGADEDADDMDLRRALLTLSPRQRAAVVLHHLHDLPVAEVAAALGCSEGTAKTHLHRGRAALAEALSPCDEETIP